MNIARNIKYKKQEMDTDKVDTIARYTSRSLKESYERSPGNNLWCYLSEDRLTYIPLSEEEVSWLKERFHNSSSQRDDELAEIYSQRINHIITEREAMEAQRACNETFFVGIFQDFRRKFKKWPISVPKWKVKRLFLENS